jgi:hypothetical protein
MRELKWSSTERAIARRSFDRVLQQELDAAIRSTKEMAARITQPSELWELEHHLTELRKAIDRKYEYKYSKLVRFFADLVCEGKLDPEDLRGLSERQAPLHPALRGKIGSLENSEPRQSISEIAVNSNYPRPACYKRDQSFPRFCP